MDNPVKNKLMSLLGEKISNLDISVEDIQQDESLLEQGVLDSMSFLEFVVSIEEAFNIELAFNLYDPSEFTSINKLTEIVQKEIK